MSGGRVTLSWTAPSGGDAAASYIVEAGSAAGRVDLANFDTGTSVTTLIADGVAPGSYFVRVRARNGAGTSGSSNEIVVTVTGSGACTPNGPANLAAKSSASTVTLSWSAPGGSCAPNGYVIEAGSAPGLSNLANFNTGTAATSFSAAGVGAGTYYVRVRASNGTTVSAPSNEATLIVSGAGCTSAPPSPSGLTGSVSGTTVSLAWGGVAGASSYVLEAGSAAGQSNLFVGDQGLATSLSATAAGGTYYVRVKARNACGTSAPSNEIVLNVQTTCAYTVTPTSTSVGSSGGALSIGVTTTAGCPWTAVSNASFITIASGGSGTGNGAASLSVAANTGSSSRTGTVTVAGQIVTVTQSGTTTQCTLTLSPTTVSIDATGGSRTITVTASAPTCSWTAQTTASFIAITSGSSGTGNGSAGLSIKANGGTAARTGTATIAGETVTISQSQPLPPVITNTGCPSQSETPAAATSIQFINLLPEPITVFRPGTNDQTEVPPQSGYTQPTQDKTVWQVKTSTQPCLGSYTATQSPGSAIVRP